MIFALVATAIVVVALLWEATIPLWERLAARVRAQRESRSEGIPVYDPGRERRAEQRARELLRSCVNDEEWEMYRDLGFIRVHGRLATEGPDGLVAQRRRRRRSEERRVGKECRSRWSPYH